jgi:outer membrane protein assembly factor BamD (BamD/ComL family)
MLRLGALYRDALHDHAKAIATFHRLYTDYAHSTKRAEALWEEAHVWRADGDAKTACDRLATMVSQFPDSRYVPCATKECPEVKRPERSGAPAECREYIEREEKKGGE